MAVGRFQAEPRWLRHAARVVVLDHPKLARELLRASSRPGRTAEVNAAEARILAEMLPGDEIAEANLNAVMDSESREQHRHDMLQQQLLKRRGF